MVTLTACTKELTPEEAFVRYVYPNLNAVDNIQAGKAHCRGCPWYFRFQASPELLSAILQQHDMKALDHHNEHVKQVLRLFDAPWWPSQNDREAERTFWREFAPSDATEPPGFRLALHRKNVVYFVAKGFPKP
ncbi:MAG: hypothetical protein K0U93_11255 [Gammaproteobacteria bacterium]|nr:hypothetical protein [Gammaproteobacteria bacterium]